MKNVGAVGAGADLGRYDHEVKVVVVELCDKPSVRLELTVFLSVPSCREMVTRIREITSFRSG